MPKSGITSIVVKDTLWYRWPYQPLKGAVEGGACVQKDSLGRPGQYEPFPSPVDPLGAELRRGPGWDNLQLIEHTLRQTMPQQSQDTLSPCAKSYPTCYPCCMFRHFQKSWDPKNVLPLFPVPTLVGVPALAEPHGPCLGQRPALSHK